MTRPAGSSVSIASATPMAPIGPSPLVPLTSASDRQSRATITVEPDATTAGPARRSAWRIARTGDGGGGLPSAASTTTSS